MFLRSGPTGSVVPAGHFTCLLQIFIQSISDTIIEILQVYLCQFRTGVLSEFLFKIVIDILVVFIYEVLAAKIIEKFGLKKPIYEPTASYGHVGRDPYKATVMIRKEGKLVPELVQFFGWELLDSVDMVRKAFNL